MTAFERLTKHLPVPLAAAVSGLWYAALIALVLLLAGLPSGRFVYDAL
jgi:hypothetical protein